MANRTSLLCDDHIFEDAATAPPEFDPERATVAEAAGGVPLLWLALFRPNDLRHWSVDDENENDLAIAAKDRALAQLHAALPRLDELLVAHGALDEYASLLGHPRRHRHQPRRSCVFMTVTHHLAVSLNSPSC